MAAVTATRLGAEERERRARLQESRGDEFSAARAAYRAFFRDWDVLLAPIVLRTAFPHHPTSWPRSEAEMTATLDIDAAR